MTEERRQEMIEIANTKNHDGLWLYFFAAFFVAPIGGFLALLIRAAF